MHPRQSVTESCAAGHLGPFLAGHLGEGAGGQLTVSSGLAAELAHPLVAVGGPAVPREAEDLREMG